MVRSVFTNHNLHLRLQRFTNPSPTQLAVCGTADARLICLIIIRQTKLTQQLLSVEIQPNGDETTDFFFSPGTHSSLRQAIESENNYEHWQTAIGQMEVDNGESRLIDFLRSSLPPGKTRSDVQTRRKFGLAFCFTEAGVLLPTLPTQEALNSRSLNSGDEYCRASHRAVASELFQAKSSTVLAFWATQYRSIFLEDKPENQIWCNDVMFGWKSVQPELSASLDFDLFMRITFQRQGAISILTSDCYPGKLNPWMKRWALHFHFAISEHTEALSCFVTGLIPCTAYEKKSGKNVPENLYSTFITSQKGRSTIRRSRHTDVCAYNRGAKRGGARKAIFFSSATY